MSVFYKEPFQKTNESSFQIDSSGESTTLRRICLSSKDPHTMKPDVRWYFNNGRVEYYEHVLQKWTKDKIKDKIHLDILKNLTSAVRKIVI